MTRMRPQIAVVGAGEAGAELLVAAEQVGARLAEAGAVLVCGGLGGVMEAACRGAREAGGLTVGLLPGTDRAAANPFVQVAIPTGMGEMRNALVVRAGEAVIAVGGGYGTLAEIGLALKARTPVVGIATWDLARPGRAVDEVEKVESPAEAVERALAHARLRGG
jgi:uncharacterized protein (TIGR00725 family)